MAEQQIIINLSAEEFERLQRLARASGARPLDIFAKEKLLALLSTNGPGLSAPPVRSSDLASVTGELKRLHRELQMFVADSLNDKDHGYVETPAGKAAEIDQIAEASSSDSPVPQSVVGIGDALPTAYNPHEIGDPTIQRHAQIADEMEDLAERAFGISPRLGAIDGASDQTDQIEQFDFSDPLDELLSEIEAKEATPVAKAGTSEKNESVSPASPPQPAHSAEPEQPSVVKQEDRSTAKNANSAAKTDADSRSEAEPDTDSQLPPPLSGGPPPRRRRP